MKFRVVLLAILIGSTIIFWLIKKPERPISDFVEVVKPIPKVSQNPPCDNPLNLTFFIEHEDRVDLSDYDLTIRISSEVAYHGKFQNPIVIKLYCPDLRDQQAMIAFEAQKIGETKTYIWTSMREYAGDLDNIQKSNGKNNPTIHVKLLAEQNKDGDSYELVLSE
jgi:hypothetical protein